MYKILGIVGPSGCGKDTAARYLSEYNSNKYHYVILSTTRPQRNSKDNGYNFLSSEDFLKQVLNGNMLNAQEFRGWYYGLSIKGLKEDKINVLPMNNIMVEQILEENRTNINLKIIYVETVEKDRLIHILNREEEPDCKEVARRFLSDYDDYVNNSSLHRATEWHIINYYDNNFFKELTRIGDIAYPGKDI